MSEAGIKKSMAGQLYKYHRYFRRTGLYQFLLRNSLKIILVLGALLGLFVYIEQHVIDFDELFQILLSRPNTFYIFAFFFVSESILGIIPPDFFIVWAGGFDTPYLAVSLLAVLSYLGGIVSHRIGFAIGKLPRVEKYVREKFASHSLRIKRWGSLFIIIAALFPLPFAIISIIAGILQYPFERFVFVSLARIVRFYIYAYFFFSFIS